MADLVLALNAGSSSLKAAIFLRGGDGPAQIRATVERIGRSARLRIQHADGSRQTTEVRATDHAGALAVCLDALNLDRDAVAAVGHRIVHGGPKFTASVALDPAALDALVGLVPFAPLHQPHNLTGVRAAIDAFPAAVQVGCFDTGFHAGKPYEHDAYALPARLHEEGVQRYGFHGLSCRSVLDELSKTDPECARGRIAIAHLGNGASVSAVQGGRSVANSMGFSTLDGLMMGTRCGSLDPGVLLWLMRERGMDAATLEKLLYAESGLLGVSGLTSDMRDIEASSDPAAKRARTMFITRAAESIARAIVTLGGIDRLVFCGGIGENAATVRNDVVALVAPLGLEPACVTVVATDEERVIAGDTEQVLTGGPASKA